MSASLPIQSVLPQLLAALQTHNQAVVQAPPGAGKTTRLPLFLLENQLFDGRIVMLEPRRLATRAAAVRMSESLNSPVGKTIGYTMRGDKKTSAVTRIEVVTEGILTRRIQSDPELSGISCLIFDEFHERSLQADLGLALALEIRAVLRPDLCIIVMSATLEAAPVAQMMGNAPIITSQGRQYPVEEHFLSQPWIRQRDRFARMEPALCELILKAHNDTSGSLLVFLPGEGEIRRTEALLTSRLLRDTTVFPLYGRMPFATQQAAIRPLNSGRKIVLATAIAETSLTIEGIHTVVDAGLARRLRFDTRSGMSRLITERVTRAEATQRMGRAGRLGPGQCYRLWSAGENGALAPFPPPEIQNADLSDLALDLAIWGCRDPTELRFLTPPKPSDFAQAQYFLRGLGALATDNTLTSHGRKMARLPLPARLSHMLLCSGKDSALVAALLAARDIFPPRTNAGSNLTSRWNAVKKGDPDKQAQPGTIKALQQDARQLRDGHGPSRNLAEMAALAYPDRVAQRRPGDQPRYLLSGGKGAFLPPDDPLAAEKMLIVTDLDGDQREAKIRLAVPITQVEVTELYVDQIETRTLCEWSKRDRQVVSRQQTCLGQLILQDQHWLDCPPEDIGRAMLEGILSTGTHLLPWNRKSDLLMARVNWLHGKNTNLPDFSPQALNDDAEAWLLPHLCGKHRPESLADLDMSQLLLARLNWADQQILEKQAPPHFTAPTASRFAIDYTSDQPMVSLRLQELYGLTQHPTIGPDYTPLLLELLSPAQRPVQTTADLPGFWAQSYQDVRKDMRGRYPRHFWPEDPATALPTRRTKPRGT